MFLSPLNVGKDRLQLTRERGEMALKVIIIGAMSSGKSALTLRFCTEAFHKTNPTISVNVSKKLMFIQPEKFVDCDSDSSGMVILKAHFWDTQGCEKFRSLT